MLFSRLIGAANSARAKASLSAVYHLFGLRNSGGMAAANFSFAANSDSPP
jgi:hypothetical protein